MRTTDIEAVAGRRAEIARELVDLDKVRAKLDAEMADLAITERVLLRLDALNHAEPMPALHAQRDAAIHDRALGMIRGLLAGRHA